MSSGSFTSKTLPFYSKGQGQILVVHSLMKHIESRVLKKVLLRESYKGTATHVLSQCAPNS